MVPNSSDLIQFIISSFSGLVSGVRTVGMTAYCGVYCGVFFTRLVIDSRIAIIQHTIQSALANYFSAFLLLPESV